MAYPTSGIDEVEASVKTFNAEWRRIADGDNAAFEACGARIGEAGIAFAARYGDRFDRGLFVFRCMVRW